MEKVDQSGSEVKAAHAAFVEAQKAFAPLHRESENPFFKSKYADLESVLAAVLPALHANSFALIQRCAPCDSGVIIETAFLHANGATIFGGTLHVPALKEDPQAYGSAITYARRYGLMAACGIAPEDDDGESARKATSPAATPPRPSAPAPSRPTAPAPASAQRLITLPQAKRLKALALGKAAELFGSELDDDMKARVFHAVGHCIKERGYPKAEAVPSSDYDATVAACLEAVTRDIAGPGGDLDDDPIPTREE